MIYFLKIQIEVFFIRKNKKDIDTSFPIFNAITTIIISPNRIVFFSKQTKIYWHLPIFSYYQAILLTSDITG